MSNFSVLISVYKNENPEWFKEALDCVFAQTVQPSEIVLVKDGPLTSELDDVIETYNTRYPIFNIVENEKNLGLGLALRKGVLACNNEIIARMDTDDKMPIDRFEKQLNKIEEGYDIVSAWALIFMDDVSNKVAIKKMPEKHEDIVRFSKRRSPIVHPCCMLRKSAVISAGNYQHFLLYEDYYLWARMIMNGSKFYNLQEVLYYLRTNEEQLKRRSGYKYLKTELKAFKIFYKMNFFSLWDLIFNSSIRIVVRLMPRKLLAKLFKVIWNKR